MGIQHVANSEWLEEASPGRRGKMAWVWDWGRDKVARGTCRKQLGEAEWLERSGGWSAHSREERGQVNREGGATRWANCQPMESAQEEGRTRLRAALMHFSKYLRIA